MLIELITYITVIAFLLCIMLITYLIASRRWYKRLEEKARRELDELIERHRKAEEKYRE